MVSKGVNPNTDMDLLWQIEATAEELRCVNQMNGNLSHSKSEALIRWNFPRKYWMKLNVDGSCYDEGEHIVCGVILHDGSGKWEVGSCKTSKLVWECSSGRALWGS